MPRYFTGKCDICGRELPEIFKYSFGRTATIVDLDTEEVKPNPDYFAVNICRTDYQEMNRRANRWEEKHGFKATPHMLFQQMMRYRTRKPLTEYVPQQPPDIEISGDFCKFCGGPVARNIYGVLDECKNPNCVGETVEVNTPEMQAIIDYLKKMGMDK